jgi:hypothetical protein
MALSEPFNAPGFRNVDHEEVHIDLEDRHRSALLKPLLS